MSPLIRIPRLPVLALFVVTACSTNPAAPTARPAEELGSLRNARVAIERGPTPAPLTYFASSMTEAERTEVARLAPHVRIVAGLDRAEAARRAAEAHGADATYASPEFLKAATNLVWLQAQSAGVDRWVAMPEVRDADRITLTNLRGVHGPAIADHVFAMLLTLTRDLPVHLAGRERGAWQRDGSGELTPIALEGRTLLVVGLGGIGTEIARRGHGFGMRVLATRRGDDPAPDFVERVAKADQLLALLPEADVVAIAVPLTPETTNLFDARAFAAMKTGSYLVNIARGKVVNQDALVEALRSKKLAGACLDVTDPEPLPPAHPLWRFPNVVITPHVAASAELTDARRWALFRENLRRFDAGEPLYNVVDKKAGY
ncbi:MAG: D-2-hydroxyacid dehydrogenase [Planctomycetota bacterium]|nr:D-2-hydroxyacid dehydrogenase [Planctomycetota bacterium]